MLSQELTDEQEPPGTTPTPSWSTGAAQADRPDHDRPVTALEPPAAYLLRAVASNDHDLLVTHLRDSGWWAVLRALERDGLITVARVGPHRRPWPWVVVQVTPAGRRRLTHDGSGPVVG